MFYRNKKGFTVYIDKKRGTSGHRFYSLLYSKLINHKNFVEYNAQVVLFNVSAPIWQIIKARLKLQKVVIRIDGLYFDKLSYEFINTFRFPIRQILILSYRYNICKDFFSFFANFLNENYTSFLKIIFANHVIYQSRFSYLIHKPFLFWINHSIIVNGSIYKADEIYVNRNLDNKNIIKVVTIYDEWRPSKRINEIIKFIEWVNKYKNINVELTIIGYNRIHSKCFKNKEIELIHNSTFIKTTPKFSEFSELEINIFQESNAYITFTYRDSCPNTVVEAMAYGLPVVAVNSGGIPDIVGEAGILINNDDFKEGMYTSHRFECEFPVIDYNEVISNLNKIFKNQSFYKNEVKERFSKVLDIEVVSKEYTNVLLNYLH
jgi:glycosyltransferase involved in cell wall biosynthesis